MHMLYRWQSVQGFIHALAGVCVCPLSKSSRRYSLISGISTSVSASLGVPGVVDPLPGVLPPLVPTFRFRSPSLPRAEAEAS